MDYKIEILRPWRYRHRKRGMQQLHVGEYRVPEDLDDWVGLLAVMQGIARRIDLVKEVAPPKKSRGRPPKNKARAFAPENKQVMA